MAEDAVVEDAVAEAAVAEDAVQDAATEAVDNDEVAEEPRRDLAGLVGPELVLERHERLEGSTWRYVLRAVRVGEVGLSPASGGRWALRITDGARDLGADLSVLTVAVSDRVQLDVAEAPDSANWSRSPVLSPRRPSPPESGSLGASDTAHARALAPQLIRAKRVGGSRPEPIVRLEASRAGRRTLHHFCGGSLQVVVLPRGASATESWRPVPRTSQPFSPTGRLNMHPGDRLYVTAASLDPANETVTCVDAF